MPRTEQARPRNRRANLYSLRCSGSRASPRQFDAHLGIAADVGHSLYPGQPAADHDSQLIGPGLAEYDHGGCHRAGTARHDPDCCRGVCGKYSGAHLQAGRHRLAVVFGTTPSASFCPATYHYVPIYRVHWPLVNAGYFRHCHFGGRGEFWTHSQHRSQSWRSGICQCGGANDACSCNF